MKNLTALIIAILFNFIVLGQEIYMDVGASTSNFNFTNSIGEEVDGFVPKTYDLFNLGYRYKYDEKLIITAGLAFTGYGSSASIALHDSSSASINVDYSTRYLHLILGGEYLIYSYNDYNISTVTQLGIGGMIHGTQNLNGAISSLTDLPAEDNDFGDAMLSFNLGVKASTPLTDNTDLYVNVLGGVCNPLPFTSDGEENLRIFGGSVSVGFAIDLILE